MRCEKERDAALLAPQELSSQPLVLWHRVVHSACDKGEMVMVIGSWGEAFMLLFHVEST